MCTSWTVVSTCIACMHVCICVCMFMRSYTCIFTCVPIHKYMRKPTYHTSLYDHVSVEFDEREFKKAVASLGQCEGETLTTLTINGTCWAGQCVEGCKGILRLNINNINYEIGSLVLSLRVGVNRCMCQHMHPPTIEFAYTLLQISSCRGNRPYSCSSCLRRNSSSCRHCRRESSITC